MPIQRQIIKAIVFSVFIFGVVLSAYAQNARKNNYFADVKSIDLDISISGDSQICGIRENDIRSAVGFTLSNSPLRRIDANSMDVLGISIIILNDKTEGGRSLGCSVAINYEFLRFVNFKGINNLVTVWSRTFIIGAPENTITGRVSSNVERVTKEFIVRWAEQN